jgi:hypothetical protein
MNWEAIGRVAYETWSKHRDASLRKEDPDYDGTSPPWNELDRDCQEAWIAAVDAACDMHVRACLV